MKRMDASVIDGTSLIIIGTLPSFERASKTIPNTKRITILQYVMRTPKHHAFIEDILISANFASTETKFQVTLKRKLKVHCYILSRNFFLEPHEAIRVEYAAACFYILSTRGI